MAVYFLHAEQFSRNSDYLDHTPNHFLYGSKERDTARIPPLYGIWKMSESLYHFFVQG